MAYAKPSQEEVTFAIDSAEKICLVGHKYEFNLDVDGKLTINKLVPGAEGHVVVANANEPGAVLFKDENIRALVDEKISNCMQNQWPAVLDVLNQ